ncbi:prostasin [Culex quinquefasciatus]|uniref:prostasin n=1 Tax=Culex quinquefasciatus TaxID=7176 RepID=UPI0018E3C4D2|nr:prostasin [Culex quinquefasciatus]
MQLFLNVLAWCVTGVGQGPFKKALEQLAGSCNKSTRSNAELTYNYTCGGTLISKNFVLTANHCIRGENGYVVSKRKIFVRLGLHNLENLNPQTFQQHNVYQIHEYNVSNNRKNDIAILELATQATFTDYVQPACLNLVEDLTGQFGTAVGWGADETDKISPDLKSQRMPVVSTIQCIENNDGAFRQILDRSIFCAGYTNGTTVCNGDSGGGIHFERNGVWYVGGIVSFTARRDARNRCHLESYAGFTDVQYFLPWLRSVTGLDFVEESAVTEGNDQLPADCGRYLVDRIYGGSNAKLYEFPWLVRLLHTNNTTGLRGCHGSLINKRYILTSADCALDVNNKPAQIELGEYDDSRDQDCNVNDASDCAPPVQRVGIESITAHPQYGSYLRDDIALVRLDRDVVLDDNIHPICLPLTQPLKQLRHQQYIVAGWGRLKYKQDFPNVLQKATVPVLAQYECQEIFQIRYDIGEDVICTGGSGHPNTCTWDNGAPLGYPSRYNDRVRFVQFGITSINGCERNPSKITFLPNYVDWILANLRP